MDIANGTKETQKIESYDGLAMSQLLNDTLEELGLRDADSDSIGNAGDLQERVQQVLEGDSFGRHKTFEERFQSVGLEKFVLDPRGFVLEPERKLAPSFYT